MTASIGRKHSPGAPRRTRVLTLRQAAFVRALVRAGGRRPTVVAREVGFVPARAADRAHRLLQQEHILAAIRHEPGGRNVLARIVARTRSRRIAALAEMILGDDSGSHAVTHGDRIRVFIDRSGAAARGYVVAHLDPGHQAPVDATARDSEGVG